MLLCSGDPQVTVPRDPQGAVSETPSGKCLALNMGL